MFRKPAWATTGRTGPIRRHKQQVFFACEGLIANYDERTSQEVFDVYTPDEFAARVRAVAREGTLMRKSDRKWMREEGVLLLRDCQALEEMIREAKEMGDPSSPAVQAFWARHRRNSTIRLSVSAGSNPDGYPQLPELPRGRDTGRTAPAVGDLPPIYVAPKRKQSGLLLGDVL